MNSIQQNLHHLWTRLQLNLGKITDSEPEQAIKIRLSIGLAVVLYFCVPWKENETFATTLFSTPAFITLSYFMGALLIVGAMILNPRSSPLRRIAGIILDLSSLSILIFYAGDESLFMFVFYLWIILGNGFRYGTKYLYISLFIGLLGFTTAVTWGVHFQTENKTIVLVLGLILLIVPLYSAFLINKLHVAIASAKHANDAKSRFLANMSHELRTPLNGVIGIADLMGETQLNYQQREFINIMKKSANSLLGLIDNVLDISKIEAGKINIVQEPFDLHLLINTIIKIQSPMGTSKRLSISCHINADTPFLLQGDQQYLRQVLVNLIGNAIKFTDEGSVKLFVYPTDNSLDAPRIRFEIQDTGIGIPKVALASIFDGFTQVKSNTNYSIDGTGLGTTIAKDLVELMGGEIGVESQLGQGSTFWFELPFTTVPYERSPLSDKHILLLMTEQTAEYIAPSLDSWGVTYEHASSSARAFSLLMQQHEQQTKYQIMVIEQSSISDIDPVKFSQMIKAEHTLEHLPLVLIDSNDLDIHDSQIHDNYISVINNLSDKRLLFNAIHAAQSVDDEKVVTLAEHFSKQTHARKLNILIAEDNRVNQQVLEGVLKHAGHTCYLAKTGEQALDILMDKSDEVDMLILDMNMPELSGIEVVQAMQYLDMKKTIPIIMLTADATPEAKENCLNVGVDVFLTKPVNSKKLLEKIAALLVAIPNDNDTLAFQKTKNSQWFDQKVINDLIELGGGEFFIHRLVKGFKEDGEKHLAIINRAVTDDYFIYRESLHALKGSATELGALKLVDLCIQCEALKPFDIGSSHILDLAEQIENTFFKTVESLEKSLLSTQVDNK